MNKEQILKELKIFNNITFTEATHQYSIEDYIFPVSSTKWLKTFTKPFNKDFWASRKAKERGITKEEIIAEWDEIARIATDEIGTPFHRYMECRLTNIDIDIISENTNLDKLLKMGDSFLEQSKQKLIPIKSELILGDKDLGIAGMVDQLYLNKDTGLLEMWDWKTSKKIDKNSFNNVRMKGVFGDYMDSNFYHYSLQLNLYQYIFEKYTNLKISNKVIAQFSILKDDYVIYECVDMQKELKRLFK